MEEHDAVENANENANAIRDKHTQIYSKIKEAIIFNRLVPGRQIGIKELGAQFGVSETPTREALFAMAHEDLLEYVPNKGFFIVPMSAERFADIYEMAFVLLKHSIWFKVRSFTLEGLQAPAGFTDDLSNRDAESTKQLAAFIERLFDRIAILSGNTMIVSAIRRFTDHTTFIRRLDLERPDRREEICNDMSHLITALTGGDGDTAVDNLQKQLIRKKQVLIDLVKEGNNRGLATF